MEKRISFKTRNSNKIKSSKIGRIVRVIVFVIFSIYALSMLYPFMWAFISSIKTPMDYYHNTFWFPKEGVHFENYLNAFNMLSANDSNMFVMIFNSLWYCIGSTFLSVFSSVMVAYAVSKYRFFGRNAIYKISIFIMMIPIVGSLPATFVMYDALNIYNSPLILISACAGFGFEFMVLYSYFRNLSWSYAEAAFVDGAGHFKIFGSIMLPQATSAIVALALISFIGNWNNYMSPILFLPDFPTLSAGLYTYQVETENKMNYPMLYAGVLMSMLPVLILFITFQNTLMDMSISGGLKG